MPIAVHILREVELIGTSGTYVVLGNHELVESDVFLSCSIIAAFGVVAILCCVSDAIPDGRNAIPKHAIGSCDGGTLHHVDAWP